MLVRSYVFNDVINTSEETVAVKQQTKEREKVIDLDDYLRCALDRAVPSSARDDDGEPGWNPRGTSVKPEERRRNGEEKGHNLHQRTLGCTSLTSACVNNSLLFLSFLHFAFMLVCV